MPNYTALLLASFLVLFAATTSGRNCSTLVDPEEISSCHLTNKNLKCWNETKLFRACCIFPKLYSKQHCKLISRDGFCLSQCIYDKSELVNGNGKVDQAKMMTEFAEYLEKINETEYTAASMKHFGECIDDGEEVLQRNLMTFHELSSNS
jgi:hypothetical protein